MKARFSRSLILTVTFLAGCSGALSPGQNTGSTTTTATTITVEGGDLPAARFVFHKDNFTDLSDFVTPIATSFQCLGDVVKAYRADGGDYVGTQISFPIANTSDALLPTTKPLFIKNVSVDVTQNHYVLTESGTMQTDACTYRGVNAAPEASSCADFDETPEAAPAPTVAPTATPNPTPIPTVTPSTDEYYDTKFYRVRDDWCTNQGPIRNADAETSKAYVGGVNIDIDRSQLGAHEDLLLQITYHSLNSNASWPGVQTDSDRTILKVKLVATAASIDNLIGVKQPRAWNDYDSAQQPVIVDEIARFEDPFGSLRTEQVVVPLSQNALIDRIRIDRIRGSYHLFQIDIYRLGNRAN